MARKRKTASTKGIHSRWEPRLTVRCVGRAPNPFRRKWPTEGGTHTPRKTQHAFAQAQRAAWRTRWKFGRRRRHREGILEDATKWLPLINANCYRDRYSGTRDQPRRDGSRDRPISRRRKRKTSSRDRPRRATARMDPTLDTVGAKRPRGRATRLQQLLPQTSHVP